MEPLIRCFVIFAALPFACHRAPTPAARDAGSFDVQSVDLDVLSLSLGTPPVDAVFDSPRDSMVLALRAHNEALALEERFAPEKTTPPRRLRLLQLHAMASIFIEYATAMPPLGFYGCVDGVTVDLHDLRGAQLVGPDGALLDVSLPAVQLRRAHIAFYLEQMAQRPAFTDATSLLELMRTPL